MSWFLLLHRVWNYEEATLCNSFDNHDFPEKGISKLCLVNELDDSLLLVASCNINFFRVQLKGEDLIHWNEY